VNVHVRLFARYRELAGSGSLELDVPPNSTALDVFNRVAERFPEMQPMRGSTLMAIDAEFVRPETEMREGEELVLMPPVSGGCSAFVPPCRIDIAAPAPQLRNLPGDTPDPGRDCVPAPARMTA
jgi:molybdopterin synthase sulfur carrier subunit